jgi:hypothetical protein
MKVQLICLVLVLFFSIFYNCNRPQESKCIFIKNLSGKIKVADLDSCCFYADKLNNQSIPLFIYINDQPPPDPLKIFYDFRLTSKLSEKQVMVVIADQKKFSVVYSDNLKVDSLLRNRYEFGRLIYDELKQEGSNLTLIDVYKKFNELFLE